MPIKRTLTKKELRDHRARGNRSANAFTQYTFLTPEEKATLQASLDSNETTEEFLEHFTADTSESDRETLASEFNRRRTPLRRDSSRSRRSTGSVPS